MRRLTLLQVNCLTQTWFDDGLRRAKELDQHFEETRTIVGPYHGLPFSLKNQFRVKGKNVSSGFLAWLGDVADVDASPVKYLRDMGAVFYCQTVRVIINSLSLFFSMVSSCLISSRTLPKLSCNLKPLIISPAELLTPLTAAYHRVVPLEANPLLLPSRALRLVLPLTAVVVSVTQLRAVALLA